MFGECHSHIIMDGINYKRAIALHRETVDISIIRDHFLTYQKHHITFIRDGGDHLGVSCLARKIAPEYNLDYRTPAFAIYKEGYYGSIVGLPFQDMRGYYTLVKKAISQGCDFIKIMISGIMKYDCGGTLSCPGLPSEDIKEMIHIAHEEGLSVMAHANGSETVSTASYFGVDSIEHGNFIDSAALDIMASEGTIFVPTLAPTAVLLGSGRFPDSEVNFIMKTAADNLRLAYNKGVTLALGSDAGAYLVRHGQGLEKELSLFLDILGDSKDIRDRLQQGENAIKKTFLRS